MQIAIFTRKIMVPLAVLAVSQGASAGRAADQEIDLDRYKLTFSEDFDSLDVSSVGPGTRWIAHTPWNGDFGSARFTDPRPGFPFQTKDGILTITMQKGSDGKWRSGLLSSADAKGRGFTQVGGYFEVRARFPTGPGVWPAFWLCSVDYTGAGKPEIDIVEHYGHDPSRYFVTVHIWKDNKDVYAKNKAIPVPAGSLSADFHTYGASIDKDFVTFYFDRKAVWREPSKPEFLNPVFVLVNLAAGGGWPIKDMPSPSVMSVDYIRAYQLKP